MGNLMPEVTDQSKDANSSTQKPRYANERPMSVDLNQMSATKRSSDSQQEQFAYETPFKKSQADGGQSSA